MTIQLIEKQINDWKKKLIDLSKRNPLLNCKCKVDGRSGAIEILHPESDVLWRELVVEENEKSMTFVEKATLLGSEESASSQEDAELELLGCLESKQLKTNHLLTLLPDDKLRNRLKIIKRNASESLSEQGVSTLYLTFGMLRYYEADSSDIFHEAPIFLVPVSINQKNLKSPVSISIEENDPSLNDSLVELLRNDYGFSLPDFDPSKRERIEQWITYLDDIEKLIENSPSKDVKRWKVQKRSVLGTFRFQKLAMWHDLSDCQELISKHPICRAIAGVSESICDQNDSDYPEPYDFDKKIHPETVFTILDSDSSQYQAINAVKRGSHLVLDGPPGTGKSQTIANIIAESLAEGKKVLFVSEKMAALDVVKKRLEDNGLGDFCLDCHNVRKNKRAFIDDIGKCLELPGEKYEDKGRAFEKLHQVRADLNAYVDSLHQKRGEMGWTAYQCHFRLASLQLMPSDVDFPPLSPLNVIQDDYDQWVKTLQQFEPLRETIEQYDNHSWKRCIINEFNPLLEEQLGMELQRIAESIEKILPEIQELIEWGFIAEIPKRSDCRKLANIFCEILKCPLLPLSWFENPEKVIRHVQELSRQFDAHQSCWQQYPNSVKEEVLSINIQLQVEALDVVCQVGLKSEAAPHTLEKVETYLNVFYSLISDLEKKCQTLSSVFSDLQTQYGFMLDNTSDIYSLIPVFDVLIEYFNKDDPPSGSWFIKSRRDELKGIIQRYADREKSNCRLYDKISMRIDPLKGFDSEGRRIANQVAQFHSFWSRMPWHSNWRRFKNDALTLFRMEQSPKYSSEIIDSIELLKRWHDENEAIEKEIGSFRNSIPKMANGNLDWSLLSQRLKNLEAIFKVFPASEKMHQTLLKESPIITKKLRGECESFQKIFAAYLELSGKLEETWKQFKVVDQNPLRTTTSLTGISDACSQMRSACLEVHKSIAPLYELKKLDHSWDLDKEDFQNIQKRIEFCIEQKERHEEIVEIWHNLQALVGNNPTAEKTTSSILNSNDDDLPFSEQEWEATKSKGEGLGQILKKFKPQSLPVIIPFVVEPNKRKTIELAYEKFKVFLAEQTEFYWNEIRPKFDVANLDDLPLDEMDNWIKNLLKHISLFPNWVRLNELSAKLHEFGFGAFLEKILNKIISTDQAVGTFEKHFVKSWLENVYKKDSRLAKFHSKDHEKLIQEFQTLDRSTLSFATKRIREKLLTAPSRLHLNTGSGGEIGTIKNEIAKKKRHLSIRQVFRKCPTIIPKLKPCLMMSPLSVSTMLPAKDYHFDLVIFDEASQVFPYDAIGAICRGKQLVVAGDQQQLPPSDYFNRTSDDGDENEEDYDEVRIGDFGSILDIAIKIGIKRVRLKWHYRSRREPLIAFSNHYYYDNQLITFPCVHDTDKQPAVQFHLVNGVWMSGGGNNSCNPIEAVKTAELVLQHFREYHQYSLGVITCNVRQQSEVEAALESLRGNQKNNKFEQYFDQERPDPFFIKNLETVQGDERDVIIFGVGYGKNTEGKMSMNFGPLNREGGERRLNVAVTRARYHVHLISSIRSFDIDTKRTSRLGPQRLQEYLEYAEHGTKVLSANTIPQKNLTESLFEEQVMQKLESRGLTVRSQIGCSGFRIDLALVNPEQPESYVIGIECDGATYHQTATARDRDRLRQEILERLGWQIIRIWSTDWMSNPDKQVERIIGFYNESLRKFKKGDVPPPSSPPPTEQPKPIGIISPNTLSQYNYKDINHVPREKIDECIRDQCKVNGRMSKQELTVSVARQLGFQRTGDRIQRGIGRYIEILVHKGEITLAEEG